MSFFKLTIKSNAASAMGPPYTMNPMTRLWRRLSSSQMIAHKMPEYVKLAEIAMVEVIGCVEDERCFSN
jgi:hypothetical protein